VTSRLAQLLGEGRFVVTGELVPPRSADPEVVRRAARQLRGLVDAVNVTDNATARVGMTPLAAAMLAAGEGLDPVLQLTCRDRNRLALTADLLGAHALGIRAVLCLSGDPMEVGRSQAKPVFDLDAVGLTRLATELGQGRAPGGTVIDPPAPFLVGVAEAPGADPSDGARLAAKAGAGARFVQTQPVYDVAQFAAWLDRLAGRGLLERVAVLAGVLPPASAAQLERFAALPGWAVPDATLARMRAARDQRAEGITLATQVVDAVRRLPGVRGVHLMGLGPDTGVPEVVQAAGLLPRGAQSPGGSVTAAG
jgi:methylenetetrahydrofolate reductase (NADH)